MAYATGFDNDKYIRLQTERIRERIGQFGGKLYLEFGGKLFDDFHASRVLPGFAPDAKLSMLARLKDEAEIVLVISANDIERAKVRGDLGITYDEDLLRLMDAFERRGFYVGSVVITRYGNQPNVDLFRQRLTAMGVRSYLHYTIEGYPYDIQHIVSDEGYGRNDYIETSRPLVVVTAPGPGSGKMATCLSQLYHEHKRGVRAGYAKFETFPIWNLPLDHPVNIAYEAATVDLDDQNAIDPFHLAAYGKTTVNYNRDIEIFPVLKAMLEQIQGKSPYQSPTDMGVNMAGFAITDDDAVRDAARREIVRRYFHSAEQVCRTGAGQDQVEKLGMLMKKAGVGMDVSPVRAAALGKAEQAGTLAGALELPDGRVITGRRSTLLATGSSLLLNAMKAQASIPDDMYIIADQAMEPISRLRTEYLGHTSPRLHPQEMLIALSTSSLTNPMAGRALSHLGELRGCDAHFSAMISVGDEQLFRSLGINVCCEPRYESSAHYHK